MKYNNDKLKKMIKKRIDEQASDLPIYYAVSGSHLYGFPSSPEVGGDIDVRGFHMTPPSRYLKLDQPQVRYQINQRGVSDGFEEWCDAELVSYELRKFTQHVYNSNFNVIEWLTADPIYGFNSEISGLWDIINRYLPMDMASGYIGLARSNHQSNYDDQPTAKHCLYALRGLLAALYVTRSGAVEPDITKLTTWYGDYDSLVSNLIEAKQTGENATLDSDLHNWYIMTYRNLIEEAEDAKIKFQNNARNELKNDLNGWMMKYRQ
ncbi:nucleotidyltransferase domain-containing protein [Halocatena halophila]|uniref:nucleotidyltransferase domain-containing protein n=1 Tax=Halocatena halophila TaxID=2814576 RepID=UPI002ECFBE0A